MRVVTVNKLGVGTFHHLKGESTNDKVLRILDTEDLELQLFAD